MKLSDINGLISGQISPASFRATNAENFTERRNLLGANRQGGVVSVWVDEDEEIELTGQDLAALCSLLIKGAVDAVELAYIADALQLADRVTYQDDWVRGYLDELTDPEVNGPFTVARAEAIVRKIVRPLA
jgi:hypothetical protein